MSENTKAAKAVEKIDADYSLEAVPESARKGFWNMFFVMVGFTFFSASMSVGAKLRDGSIDAAICLMPRGANAAYAYSRAYYDDPCYILVKPGNENADMSKLKVGCIQSASSSNLYVPSGATRNLLFSYYSDYKDSGYNTASITGYASYTDLFDALDKGQVDAIAINELMLNKYGEGRAYAKHTADIGTLHYAVATLSANSAIATVADMMLSEMGY